MEHAFFAPGDRTGARHALGLDPHRPVLLFVGRIQPLKSADVAVKALHALDRPDAVLVIVGGASGVDGDAEVEKLLALVDELGLGDRVRFVPPQPHHLLSSWYRAADVVLVPSRSESFGLVALEAAACGTPVVAAAVGGLLTLVDHGHTGFLVEGRDPEVYAAYTAELLENERAGVGDGRHARRPARGATPGRSPRPGCVASTPTSPSARSWPARSRCPTSSTTARSTQLERSIDAWLATAAARRTR